MLFIYRPTAKKSMIQDMLLRLFMHLYIDYTPFLHKYTHVQVQKRRFHIAKKGATRYKPRKAPTTRVNVYTYKYSTRAFMHAVARCGAFELSRFLTIKSFYDCSRRFINRDKQSRDWMIVMFLSMLLYYYIIYRSNYHSGQLNYCLRTE